VSRGYKSIKGANNTLEDIIESFGHNIQNAHNPKLENLMGNQTWSIIRKSRRRRRRKKNATLKNRV
jgi:hypothetical protein